jgi:hypothetical protein
MATVEGYELHVYCDVAECRGCEEFGGVSRADCLDQARRLGWVIGPKRAPAGAIAGGLAARCPTHSGKRPNPRPLPPGARVVTLAELRNNSRLRSNGQ